MRVLKVLADFFFDLIIGDDPKIAVAVVLSLVVAALLLVTGVPGSAVVVVGALTVVAAFTLVLVVDIRSMVR